MLYKNLQEKAVKNMEIPGFVNQLNYVDLLGLLRVPNLSEWFLEQALQRRKEGRLCSLLYRHPSITDRLKKKLIATQNGEICLYFAQQKNLNDSLIVQLSQVEITNSSPSRNNHIRNKIRFAIANNPNTKLDILQRLTEETDYTVRISAKRRVASHPETSLSVIKQLAFDAESSVKKAVASRHDLPIELIKEMAKDYQIARKRFLVHNLSISLELLDKLAKDSHPKVQQLVALHPNTSETTLIKLANNPRIGIFILDNPNLTTKIFEQLVSSHDPKLNFALAKHSWTNRETLEEIAVKSEDAATLIALVENNQTRKKIKSEILTRLAKFSSRSIRQYVANNPYTPENILWHWGTSQRYYKLHPLIAKIPASSTILLDYLTHNFNSRKVYKGLITNPNTSEDILNYLCSKERKQNILNTRKINAIAKEHKIPVNILKKLIGTRSCFNYRIMNAWYSLDLDEKQKEITFETIDKRIKIDRKYYSELYFACTIYLIQNSTLPLATIEFFLEQIAQSRKADKRKFAARHPKTPISALGTLAKDKDQGVKQAAIFRLQQRQNKVHSH